MGKKSQNSSIIPLSPPNLYRIEVQFDSTTHIFSYSGAVDPGTATVNIEPGLAMIAFTLRSPQNHRLMFADDPVTWVDSSGFPKEIPSCFRLQRDAFDQITVIDFNTTPDPITYGLRLHVVGADNTVYTSHDPAIVNTEIGGG